MNCRKRLSVWLAFVTAVASPEWRKRCGELTSVFYTAAPNGHLLRPSDRLAVDEQIRKLLDSRQNTASINDVRSRLA